MRSVSITITNRLSHMGLPSNTSRSSICTIIHWANKEDARKSSHVYLKATNYSDIEWWIIMLSQWNGLYLFEEVNWQLPGMSRFYTDASDWGGSACFGQYYTYFSWRKDIDLTAISIQVREMFVIVVAMLTFQRLWKRKQLLVETDSQANILSVARGACSNPLVHELIKSFISTQILGSFSLRLVYINTHDNIWADALSRGDPNVFKEAEKDPKFISPIFPPDFLIIV